MASLDYSNKTYVDLVRQALADFDSIFGALVNKGLLHKNDKGVMVPLAASDRTSGEFPTSSYAGLISSQLYTISGNPNAGNQISNYVGQTVNASSILVDYATTNSITLNVGSAGYYDSSSKLRITIPAVTATVSGLVQNLTGNNGVVFTVSEDNKNFKITPPSNKILTEVTIPYGSVHAEVEESKITNTVAISSSVDISNSSTIGTATKTAPTTAQAANFEKLIVTHSSTATGSISVEPTIDYSAGYIDSSKVNVHTESISTTFHPKTNTTGSDTIYIPKATISNITGSSVIGLDTGSLETVTKPEDGIAIVASANDFNVSGTITEGYIKDGSISGTASLTSTTKYIKKGAVAPFSKKVNLTTTNTSELILNSSDEDAYKIKFNLDSSSTSGNGTITPGYINASGYTGTISMDEKTLSIPKAAVKVDTALSAIDLTASDLTYLTKSVPVGETANYYTISTKATAVSSIDTTVTKNGYLKDDIVHSGFTNASGENYFLRKGRVQHTSGLSNDLYLAGEKQTNPDAVYSNILLNTKPTGDFFEITTTCNEEITEGYIKAGDVTSTTSKYYLPRAVVEYVENSAGNNFYQVKTAGFLPSGAISNISGELDEAVLSAALATNLNGTAVSGILSTATKGANDYTLTISKNALGSDAGYMSAQQGTLNLAENYYIKHGAISLAGAITLPNFTNVEPIKFTKTGVNGTFYKFTGTASATISPTLTEGYIKSDDVTNNGILSQDVYAEMPGATFTDSDTSIKLTTVGNNIASAGAGNTSRFFITPGISNEDKTVAKSATAGYVEAGTPITITPQVASGSETFYVKEGAEVTNATATINNLTFNKGTLLSGTTGNQYTITVSGSGTISGRVGEGYYTGASNDSASSISGTAVIGTSGVSTTIAKGSVSGNASISTEVTKYSDDLVLYTSTEVGNATADYHKITAGVKSFAANKVVSEGYVKEADVTAPTTATTTEEDVYILRYTASAATVNEESVFIPFSSGITGGSDGKQTTTINVAGKYVDKNIQVSLNKDAMGEDVVSAIDVLRARLSGTTVPSNYESTNS